MRVTRTERSSDSVTSNDGESARVTHRPVVVTRPRVVGDSVLGRRDGSSTPVAVALADVRRAEQRRFNGTRTTLMVGGVIVGVGVIAAGVAAALGGPMGAVPICVPGQYSIIC